MLKKIFIAIILNVILINSPFACTVWGAITPSELFIAKNRDFHPGDQKFITISHKNKYKFFGLYADNEYDNHYIIKMGINEKGLVVFMTFASTIPRDQRVAKIPYSQVMENILENYKTVDDINKDSKLLFQDSTPINYIFADRNKALLCEIGLNNNYKCESYSRSSGKVTIFSQTNHYIFPELKRYNLTPAEDQKTSYFRLSKINELMTSHLEELTLDQFINFSFNTVATNDNPLSNFDEGYDNTYQDNSIFRTFNSHPDRKDKTHPNSDRGVSSMIVKLPYNKNEPNEPIELYLRIINGITDFNNENYTQNINYSAANTTLEKAIKNPGSIKYIQKSCRRDKQSSSCM